ncbi:hypothetical protein Mgra_00008870 [Meloidogyne graminicola]|uniref:Origin recognition complex subunit 5 C-terminal domain-containing protein n=1 Tax=Meloidogyne graminicola TaxID=189291 RepID=A0A8S9ZEH0_9BILA|nr:hypothetical protein Mgra_00008870 [Meloidogyne graminicola]
MDLPLDVLAKKVQQLIQKDNKATNLDLIVKETGLPKQFVNYVIESVILHYNDIEILKHIVIFVAETCKKEGIKIQSSLTASFAKKIDPVCKILKDDLAFFPNYKDDNLNKYMDIPFLTRFAIVATYCASYNPPISDQRFFFKTDISNKRRKVKGNLSSNNSKEKFHDKGPRPFDHQRALFIFLFFCKNFDESFENVGADFQIDFTSQITHLVDLGLLRIVSATENLDLPQYLSLCDLDFTKKVAHSISDEFKLENYLWDFVND